MMNDLSKKLAKLSPEQRELFELLMQKENNSSVRPPALRKNDKIIAPLAYAQQGLWIAANTGSTSPFHHPLAFRISGPLDVVILEQSLTMLCERHEILRTTYIVENGEAVQVINRPEKYSIPIVDLQNLNSEQKRSETEKIVNEEGVRPFDLVSGPMLRIKLIKWNTEEYVLIIVANSFISDGFSFGLLLNEFGSCYKSFINNESPKLSTLQVQFSDFAIWQKEMIEGGFFNDQFEYWKNQLKNCPPKLNWPVQDIESLPFNFKGETYPFLFSADFSSSLRNFARTLSVTPFMLFLTSIKLLIHKITMQDDFVIGTLASNRSNSELEPLIGYFGNNIILRCRPDSTLSFRQIIENFNDKVLESFANQDYPFEKLLEESSKEGTELTVPQLQVMFVLHDHAADEDFNLQNVNLNIFPVKKQTSIFDLYFRVIDAKGEIAGSVEYNSDIFDVMTIKIIVEIFKDLLEKFIKYPDKKIVDINIIEDSMRMQLIHTWNNFVQKKLQKEEAVKSLTNHKSALYVKPETEIEQTIVSVWEKVFKLDKVSVNDNFFDLGGKSLQLMEVHNRLQKMIDKKITIIDLFEYPTVKTLAKYISNDQNNSNDLKASFDRAQTRRESRIARKRN